jgi:hypothetical protein
MEPGASRKMEYAFMRPCTSKWLHLTPRTLIACSRMGGAGVPGSAVCHQPTTHTNAHHRHTHSQMACHRSYISGEGYAGHVWMCCHFGKGGRATSAETAC